MEIASFKVIVGLIEIIVGIAALIFSFLAIHDIIKRKRLRKPRFALWVLVVIFVPLIGPLLYMFINDREMLKHKFN